VIIAQYKFYYLKIVRKNRAAGHPALNINTKRIMIKATIFALKIVVVTLAVAYLIAKKL
jgi:hypothetical protein